MNLKVNSGWAMIKPNPRIDKTRGGIYIPTNQEAHEPIGFVLAMGEGRRHPKTGVRRDPGFKPGEFVIFTDYTKGAFMQFGSETYLMLKHEDILGVVEYEDKDNPQIPSEAKKQKTTTE